MTCQAWSSQSPHTHIVLPASYPNQGIDVFGNNRCRNPDKSKNTIWCHTTDPAVPFEECLPIGYCKNTLASTGVTSKTVNYEDPLHILSVRDDLLVNTKDVKCNLKQCTLLNADCSGPYTGSEISMTSTSEYNVQFLQMVAAGQSATVCFECSNDYDIVAP